MVTRNPNQLTEILWYEIGYVKGKMLSPLKSYTRGRLHCWFCLKLLKICSSVFYSSYHVPDSEPSKYVILRVGLDPSIPAQSLAQASDPVGQRSMHACTIHACMLHSAKVTLCNAMLTKELHWESLLVLLFEDEDEGDGGLADYYYFLSCFYFSFIFPSLSFCPFSFLFFSLSQRFLLFASVCLLVFYPVFVLSFFLFFRFYL